MPNTSPRPFKPTIPQIESFLNEIEDRLPECSPETLLKVASTLCFAIHWIDKGDVLNAEYITERESR